MTSDSAGQPDAKTSVLRTIAHDLRQPLQAIGLWSIALKARAPDPEIQKIAARIHDSLAMMGGMLDQVSEYARLGESGAPADIRELSLDILLDEVAAHWRALPEGAGARIVVHHSGLRTRSDAGRLQRVLHHAMANAIKYCPHGPIMLCARRAGAGARIEVRDRGGGMDAHQLALAFEPCRRLPARRPENDKGLGLGLAIARALADSLGHPCALQSRSGHGTVFSVQVPRLS